MTDSHQAVTAMLLPCLAMRITSRLNCRACPAAGQACGSLHMMMVYQQAYQADLVKDFDQGQGLSPEVAAEPCHTIDLDLQATK